MIHFLGDGGALMTGSELATAMQYGAKVKTFISNNGSYGTIRMHQEIAYKGRVHGTELKNPDFAKWAESFGALGLDDRQRSRRRRQWWSRRWRTTGRWWWT